MNPLIIKETKSSPSVRLYPNGELFIEGRSLPENPVEFYSPVLAWVKNCDIENVIVSIRLEYMNTSSSKKLYTFLKMIEENPNIKTSSIKWYYEEGDDDVYETGRELEMMFKSTFTFHEFSEILD